jgi:ankyrin repeat protein
MSHRSRRQLSRIAISISALCWLGIASSCYKDNSKVNDACAASAWGDTAKVQALLKADPGLASRRHSNGDTPLHCAALYGRRDVAALLLANGADVNAKGHEGTTPLYNAVWNNHEAVVELLLSKQNRCQC